jgi:exosortase A
MRATLSRPAAFGGLLPILAAFAGIGLLYYGTLASLVSVWLQSATFQHCFLIAPISLYLIWQRRAELAQVPTRVSPKGIVAVLVLAIGWLVAASANVQLGQQLMVVLMIPAAVLALTGEELTKRIAFPLGFLLLSVPFGEWTIQPLMNFTADFAVAALRLTGIPVLHEGVYFSIPSGDFEVAKGCSGIRYLIACSAIGVLYAYLTYRSLKKRLLFVALSIVVPIVGNGIRAYLIVMIAHLSEMRLAVGVDHLIYGWIFFAVIVAAMLWVGSLFKDPERVEPAVASQPSTRAPVHNPPRAATATATALVVALAAVGPVSARALHSEPLPRADAVLLPEVAAWQGPSPTASSWQKPGNASIAVTGGSYVSSAGNVELVVLSYGPLARDQELVGSVPGLIETQHWQILGTQHTSTAVAGAELGIQETQLRSLTDYAVLWHWYLVGDTRVSADWWAKVLEAVGTLRHGRSDTVAVVVAARSRDLTAARDAVQRFLADSETQIMRCLEGPAVNCAPAPPAGP